MRIHLQAVVLVLFTGIHFCQAAENVELRDMGNTVLLSNDQLKVTIDKSAASITSMQYRGYEMLSSGYYSMDGGADYRRPLDCHYSIKINTPDLVDISMKRIWKDEPQAFDIDVHYVLKKGDSGIYSYALLDHPSTYPATRYGEWRMVWKLSNQLLERIYVDDSRHWDMPTPEDYKNGKPTPIKEITELTSGKWAGKYDCKYDYSSSYYDIGCWGHASNINKIGAWIVLGGYDYFNDGPTKQDLNAASGINHIHFGMNHYNGSTPKIEANEHWQKIYGPFLLYCNHDNIGADACWTDAKKRVDIEKKQWPYNWLTDNSAYPTATQRGSVGGKFIIHDSLKPKLNSSGAWIGLAQTTPDGNWQFESKNYQYWSKVGSDGSFTIPNIRPGTYTLYSFTDGAIGEFSKSNVVVETGKVNSLGNITWEVPHKGSHIAWEIGIPDRTAKEFRHGNDYFHGYVWKNFGKEWTNPLEYTVGKSDWSKDWNYAQTGIETNGQIVPHQWNIHFKLDNIPNTGQATLTLAIASAQHAQINIFVNDKNRPMATITPSVQGGNALLRESIHAKYCVEYVSIPTDQLKQGENTISLILTNTKGSDTHVMYDYINLELP